MKKAKITYDVPNPLFEKWLEEWRLEAKSRNLDIQHSFGKALASLKKYPGVLQTGKECIILDHFGPKICNMLDKKLAYYKKEPEEKAIDAPSTSKQIYQKEEKIIESQEKILKSSEMYALKKGSGAYAIMLTMYKNHQKLNYPGFMLKKDIISQAKEDSDCPLVGCSFNSYSGWSGMTILIEKGLAISRSCPAKYSFTDKGLALALMLFEGCINKTQSVQDIVPQVEMSRKDEVIVIDDDHDDNDIDAGKNVHLEKKEFRVDHHGDTEMDLSKSDEDFEEFCKENEEPVINVQKNSFNFIFSENHEDYQSPNTKTHTLNEIPIQNINIPVPVAQIRVEKETGAGKSTKKPKTQKKNQNVDEIIDDSFILLPNNFDIILLVDTQETSGGKTKAQDDATLSELTNLGVLYEVRSLKVGDFTWIARCRITRKELVLPYIVERKRIDDLSASITDGRYREQKHRLKQSGIKYVTYLIEDFGKNYHGAIPMASLFQAGVNSLVQDIFNVTYTKDHKDSMRYLSTKTKILTEIYESKELVSCKKKDLESIDSYLSSVYERFLEFSEFNKGSVKTKNFKVQDMFIKQLLQLKGLSKQKAIAIAEKYSTPKNLTDAFVRQGENLLSDLKTDGSTVQKIGPAISTTLYKFYTSHDLL